MSTQTDKRFQSPKLCQMDGKFYDSMLRLQHTHPEVYNDFTGKHFHQPLFT